MTRSNLFFILRMALATMFCLVALAFAYWIAYMSEAEGRTELIELYLFCLMLVSVMGAFIIFLLGGVVSIVTWDFRVTDEVGQALLAILLTSITIALASWWVLTRIFELSIP